jgi:uncharacterized membrane protein
MKELITLLLGMAPISELRGAIPFGLSVGLPTAKTIFLAVMGNIIPVIPLLLFLETVSTWLSERSVFFKNFFEWLFARTRRHSKLVERFEILGLILFVGIPLPVTGAWTGCAAAFLFGIRFWRAFLAILLGICMSATIVSTLALGIANFGALTHIFLK